MSYYDRVLELDGTWMNRGGKCTLPSDQLIKDPIKLAELSGSMTTYFIEPAPRVYEQEQRKLDTYNY